MPESSRVGQKGFTASWRVLEMNRDYLHCLATRQPASRLHVERVQAG
ncbi:MAG: hypothetical protein ACM3X6_04535 [Patescibacteria group bacterium]